MCVCVCVCVRHLNPVDFTVMSEGENSSSSHQVHNSHRVEVNKIGHVLAVSHSRSLPLVDPHTRGGGGGGSTWEHRKEGHTSNPQYTHTHTHLMR